MDNRSDTFDLPKHAGDKLDAGDRAGSTIIQALIEITHVGYEISWWRVSQFSYRYFRMYWTLSEIYRAVIPALLNTSPGLIG